MTKPTDINLSALDELTDSIDDLHEAIKDMIAKARAIYNPEVDHLAMVLIEKSIGNIKSAKWHLAIALRDLIAAQNEARSATDKTDAR